MSQPLKISIMRNLKMIRTQLEPLEEFKPTVVLFMMDQLLLNMVFINPLLKERKKKLRVQLVELLLSLTLKKLLPRKQSSLLSLLRDNSSKKVMLMSLLPNRSTINNPKTRRTQLEPPEESKPTVALSTMDQFSADTVSIILSLKEKEKKLRVQLAVLLLSLTPRKLLQRKQFSPLLPNREDSRCRAMPMSLPPNRNIINKQKTIRTESELPDESKLTEVLFTMDQFSRNTVFIILSLKERKRKLRVQLVELLLSLTLKKLLPRKQSSPLSPLRDNSSKKATPMSLLPNKYIINKLKTKRTQSEPPEESKPTAA